MTVLYPPAAAVREAVAGALAEDLLPIGDLTAALLPLDTRRRAAFVARAGGVVAGRSCVEETYRQLDTTVSMEWHLDDGAEVAPGGVIAIVEGPLPSILTGERTALNFMCHLSGVASLTRRYVDAVAGTGARVWDTRKTTPGLRALEKAAVRAGGGANHRGSLSEMVLIKDNHLGGMSITDAVARARERWPARTIEVECDRLDQAREAVEAGADIVMLDNMGADDVAKAVSEVGGRALVEVSGGVTLDNIADLARAGPNLISVGALTHSAPILDIGLDLEAVD